MLAGRVQEITMGHPYKKGKDAQTLIDLKLIDPLQKIGKVSLSVWSGANAKNRADAPPPPSAGDPKRREVKDLPVKKGVASVDLTLPSVAAGEVYWLQPSYTDGAGGEPKMAADPLAGEAAGRPRADRPGTETQGEQYLRSRIDQQQHVDSIRDAQGEEHTLTSTLKAGIVETVKSVDSQGIASVHLKYTRLTLGAKLDNQPIKHDKHTAPGDDSQSVQGRGRHQGRFQGVDHREQARSRRRASKLPGNRGGAGLRIQKSLEAMKLSLPGKRTEANVVWTGQHNLPIETVGDDEFGVVDAQYFYLGHRQHEGTDEALVDIKGIVKGNKGNGLNLGGHMQGSPRSILPPVGPRR